MAVAEVTAKDAEYKAVEVDNPLWQPLTGEADRSIT